jgi:hypothetical protein
MRRAIHSWSNGRSSPDPKRDGGSAIAIGRFAGTSDLHGFKDKKVPRPTEVGGALASGHHGNRESPIVL